MLCGLVAGGCDGGSLLGTSPGAALDAQVLHPNGTVIQLVAIKAAGDRTLVTIRVLNGRERQITLNRGRENSYLLSDSGEKLFLVPPAGNPNLAVPAGQVMDGALVFSGALPRSERATLLLNENGSADGAFSASPRFQIALPLSGAFGGSGVPETSALSNMRPLPASSLRPAATTVSRLGAGGQATSDLRTVEALKSELGATETDRGTIVSLPGDVTFDFDKATIRDSAQPTLDRLAALILAGPAGQISIEGHTDAKGDDAYNKRLSEQRADAVKAYLSGKQVDPARLRTIGLGELRPAAPNAKPDGSDDEDGRQRNRRVEVVLPKASPAA
jgi:outer membrane protein OmpA-like peptidoglycan-associated protein